MKYSTLLVGILATFASASCVHAGPDDSQGRHQVPTNWWESAAAMVRLHLGNQLPLNSGKAESILDDLKARGISAIEIFAPYHGGRSYGNVYLQPEGAGGFHEDPVAWITEGGWNSVQEYGLGIWWEKNTEVLARAVETANPRPIERALRDYHDRVVAAGGIVNFAPESWPRSLEPAKQRLIVATAVSVGDLVSCSGGTAQKLDSEITKLFQMKAAHPALHQLGTRRQIPTSADDKYYAFLRTAKDGSDRILVVMNFQPEKQNVTVDLSGVGTAGLVDLESKTESPREGSFKVELPAYGYRLFQVNPPSESGGPAR